MGFASLFVSRLIYPGARLNRRWWDFGDLDRGTSSSVSDTATREMLFARHCLRELNTHLQWRVWSVARTRTSQDRDQEGSGSSSNFFSHNKMSNLTSITALISNEHQAYINNFHQHIWPGTRPFPTLQYLLEPFHRHPFLSCCPYFAGSMELRRLFRHLETGEVLGVKVARSDAKIQLLVGFQRHNLNLESTRCCF